MAGVTRAQKTRLGIFVGSGLAVLLAAFMALAGRALLEERDTYYIRFSNRVVSFSGLAIGSDLKYSGIKVGRVEGIRIAPDDVSVIEVTVSVAAGTPMASDSKASVASLGITGLKYIELSRGSREARLLKPGETIASGEALIDELSAQALSLTTKLDELLVNIKAMTGEDTRTHINRMLESSATMLEESRPRVASILNATQTVTQNISEASEHAVKVVDGTQRLMGQLNALATDLRTVVGPEGQVQSTVQQVSGLVSRVNMLVVRSEQDLDITLSNLREASANLSDLSLELRDNPSILINPSAGSERGRGGDRDAP